MLFNSAEFIFYFLPATFLAFYLLAYLKLEKPAIGCLVLASLFFYSWWNPIYLPLLAGSILVNYGLGRLLSRERPHRKALLFLGIALNLGAIGYFKYANFFIDNVNLLTGSETHLARIVLPLAISFFTFQQIAYLVDAYRGEIKEHDFLYYGLFVSFFPQLIAGPIVHHKEVIPQYRSGKPFKLRGENIAIGLSIFVIGLAKKIIIADQLAGYADPVFLALDSGKDVAFFDAWGGVLAYGFQLYFDFSGYSDMAVGLARMFGITLPWNFLSPYKARNIIDFWRSWHITLSRFLRDYLYFALGGNRLGKARRYSNLMVTMLLGGLWHGAHWNFIIWGGLHGLFLVINHAWRRLNRSYEVGRRVPGFISAIAAQGITFLSVTLAWVFFRATTTDGAFAMLLTMSGAEGIYVPVRYEEWLWFLVHEPFNLFRLGDLGYAMDAQGWALILAAAMIAFIAPNTRSLAAAIEEARLRPMLAASAVAGIIFAVILASIRVEKSPFLYFNF